jgi:hypothetical protein
MVQYSTPQTPQFHEVIKEKLMKMGALDVRKESIISKAIKYI